MIWDMFTANHRWSFSPKSCDFSLLSLPSHNRRYDKINFALPFFKQGHSETFYHFQANVSLNFVTIQISVFIFISIPSFVHVLFMFFFIFKFYEFGFLFIYLNSLRFCLTVFGHFLNLEFYSKYVTVFLWSAMYLFMLYPALFVSDYWFLPPNLCEARLFFFYFFKPPILALRHFNEPSSCILCFYILIEPSRLPAQFLDFQSILISITGLVHFFCRLDIWVLHKPKRAGQWEHWSEKAFVFTPAAHGHVLNTPEVSWYLPTEWLFVVYRSELTI